MPPKVIKLMILWIMPFVAFLGQAGAEPAPGEDTDLTELSLQALMNIEVSSVAKKPQSLADAAAAVYILSQDDLRRSGVTSLPEALRMVPGLQVAQIDANKWAITSRGFNGRFANKMLVLMDGRSVYTPLFAGVYWHVQDTMIEDIERIEIIRGPGATLWGANAVNGVINIITKSSADTGGGIFSTHIGDEQRARGSVRYGGVIGDNAHYRAYGKFLSRDDAMAPSGGDASDGWEALRSGFRFDWDLPGRDRFTLQGDLYDGEAGQQFERYSLTPPYAEIINDESSFSGSNLQARWSRSVSDEEELELRFYYDRTQYKESRVDERRQSFDIDFQHRRRVGERQDVIWGVGFHRTADDIEDSEGFRFDPDERDDQLISAFVQDDIGIGEDNCRLTLGSKFEYNDYTGFEVQPNIRALWKLRKRDALWMAASRAVRTPPRAWDDVAVWRMAFPDPGGGPTNVVALFGNRDTVSEELMAYEAGYRTCTVRRTCVDVATFYNDYDNLTTIEMGAPFLEADPAPIHVILPQILGNKMKGSSYGVEISSNWELTHKIHVSAWYSYFTLDLTPDATSTDPAAQSAEGDAPKNQAHVRAYFDLPRGFRWDVAAYHVDDLPTQGVSAYTRLDTRFSWQRRGLEASLALQNLLDSHHQEYGGFVEIPTEVERSIYGRIEWRF